MIVVGVCVMGACCCGGDGAMNRTKRNNNDFMREKHSNKTY